MGKSIRSKVMRKNRSTLRKTLVDPIMKKNQEKCANDLDNAINQRAGSSIGNLKSLLHNGTSMEMDDEAPEKEVVLESANRIKLREKIALLKNKKKTGSKARMNPGKELTWF